MVLGNIARGVTTKSTKSVLRKDLLSQASRLSLKSSVAIAAAAGLGLFAPTTVWAQCVVGVVTVTCGDTPTTDTSFPANAPDDRDYPGVSASPIQIVVTGGKTVSGNGLSISNTGTGGVTVTNGGTISVDAGNTPVAGGTAALSVKAAGGSIVYTGGDIVNNGNGNAFDAVQTGGLGSVNLVVGGNVAAATGAGITVRDVATSTGISVTTGAVTALTAGKNAIDVQSQSLTGNLTEVANGNIQAGNAGMVGAILNAAATGNIDVTANGSINARFGVDAENFGKGNTSVTTVGPVTATSGNGIFALSAGGNVTVNAGDVTSTGNIAIIAQQTAGAGTGAVSVTAGNVSGTTGISATNFGSGTIGITTTGTVTGTSAEGILATGRNAVSVSVANTVTGATRGLSLIGGTGGAGNILVTGTGGFVGGTGDAANIRNDGSGTTIVTIAGASSSTGGNGFFVRDTAAGGNISVTTGAVTALTAGKNAIDVQSQSLTGNVNVVANGDVKAGNAGLVAAIINGAATGAVAVTANGKIDARFGVDAENFGSGNTSVTTLGAVTATSGNGIFALSTGGNVMVSAGDVTATGNTAIVAQQINATSTGSVAVTTNGAISGTTGIVANNLGSGAITVVANRSVTGTTAEGIKASGNGAVTVKVADTVTGATNGLTLLGGAAGTGDISVTGAGGFAGGSGNGATIQNAGSGTVTINLSGAISATAGNGIVVTDTATGGNITVTTGKVTALGANANGIDVRTIATAANVTVVANGDISAANAGVLAAVITPTGTGNVDVTTSGKITGRFGIDAENFGSGTTTVNALGAIGPTTGNGIFALSTGGGVKVTAGSVTSTGDTAILAQQVKAGGAGTVQVVNSGSVSGTNGIVAQSAGSGTVTVTTNGAVTGTAGTAVFANSTGLNGSVVVAVNKNATATNGAGIVARLQGGGNGTITVTQGASSVINATNGHGIQTNSGTSTGATVITVAGEVKASGANNAGILGTSTNGAITVNVTATGKVDPDFGIALNTVGGALNVNNAGLIIGDITGVQLVATGAGTATVNNSGTITGPNAIVGNFNGGAFNIGNTGTLNGAVRVSGSNVATSTFSNTALGTANFGVTATSFSGTFSNLGTANIGAGGSAQFLGNTGNSGRLNFLGAGTFTTVGSMSNTGIINAQNGLTTNVVTVGGSYSGGGQFFVDYSTLTASADRLNIVGAATGNTNVRMSLVGARTFVPGGFLPIVVVNPGAAIGTFTSDTVFATTGFILDSFGRNPGNASQFGLIQSINPSALPLGSLSLAAETASSQLDESMVPYLSSRTDEQAGGVKLGLWMRASSGYTKQTIATSITGGGVGISSNPQIRIVHQSVQGGGDVRFGLGADWNLHVGVTGGIYDGAAGFSNTDRIAVDASFLGGYIALRNSAFSIDGTIRKEWRTFDVTLPTLLGATPSRQLTGSAIAGSAHASYRFGGKTGLAATPFLGFTYADADFAGMQIDPLSLYTPTDHTTKIGEGGMRVSYRGGSDAKVTIEPFAGVSYRKNWSNTDTATLSFAAPATVFTLNSSTWDHAVRYSLGVTGSARDGRISGFLVGNLNDGSQIKSFAVSGGLRFNF